MEAQIKINGEVYSHVINAEFSRRRRVAVHAFIKTDEEIFPDISSTQILRATYDLRVNETELEKLRQAKQQRIVTLEDLNRFTGTIENVWFHNLEETYVPKKDRPWLVRIILYIWNYPPTGGNGVY